MLSDHHDKTRKWWPCHVCHTREFCRRLLSAVLLGTFRERDVTQLQKKIAYIWRIERVHGIKIERTQIIYLFIYLFIDSYNVQGREQKDT